ncbi:DUF6053 domain-containing protein [Lysobacter enzymogenes]
MGGASGPTLLFQFAAI